MPPLRDREALYRYVILDHTISRVTRVLVDPQVPEDAKGPLQDWAAKVRGEREDLRNLILDRMAGVAEEGDVH